MSGIGSGIFGLLASIPDLIIQAREYEDAKKARQEGVDILRGIGPRMLRTGLRETAESDQATRGINNTLRDSSLGILSSLRGDYFGRNEDGSTKAFGEGGMVGDVRARGSQLVGDTKSREDARVGADQADASRGIQDLNSRYTQTVTGIKQGYDDTVRAADLAYEAVLKQSGQAVAEARTMRGSDISAVDDQSAAAVAGISAAAAPALQQVFQGLHQKYAGQDLNDPNIKARFEADKQAAQLGYMRSTQTSIGEAKAQFTAIRSDLAAKHALSINSLNADLTRSLGDAAIGGAQTRASAFSTLTSGLADTFKTVTDGTLSYDNMMASSRALRSQLVSGAEGSVFSEMNRAFETDASMLSKIADSNLAIENDYANSERTRELNRLNGVLGAWNAWASGESQTASALVNWQSFQTSFADPFWRFADHTTNQSAIDASRDNGSFGVSALGMGFQVG